MQEPRPKGNVFLKRVKRKPREAQLSSPVVARLIGEIIEGFVGDSIIVSCSPTMRTTGLFLRRRRSLTSGPRVGQRSVVNVAPGNGAGSQRHNALRPFHPPPPHVRGLSSVPNVAPGSRPGLQLHSRTHKGHLAGPWTGGGGRGIDQLLSIRPASPGLPESFGSEREGSLGMKVVSDPPRLSCVVTSFEVIPV